MSSGVDLDCSFAHRDNQHDHLEIAAEEKILVPYTD